MTVAVYLESGHAGASAGLHGAGPNAQGRGAANGRNALQPRSKLVQVDTLSHKGSGGTVSERRECGKLSAHTPCFGAAPEGYLQPCAKLQTLAVSH